MQFFKNTNIDFMSKTKYAVIISGILIASKPIGHINENNQSKINNLIFFLHMILNAQTLHFHFQNLKNSP